MTASKYHNIKELWETIDTSDFTQLSDTQKEGSALFVQQQHNELISLNRTLVFFFTYASIFNLQKTLNRRYLKMWFP